MKINLNKAYLNVTTTAVNILFVFYLELNNKSLVFVRERFFELSRNAVELRILAGLNTCETKFCLLNYLHGARRCFT